MKLIEDLICDDLNPDLYLDIYIGDIYIYPDCIPHDGVPSFGIVCTRAIVIGPVRDFGDTQEAGCQGSYHGRIKCL